MNRQVIYAWLVHIFTASGIIPAFYAIIAVSEKNFLMAFVMLMIAHFIDGVDGTLARRARVTEVLPWMSGKMMDCIIDFSTYAIIPAYAMYMMGPEFWPSVPYVREVSIMLVLLVSTLYYGKEGMVSSDYYFIGFPVLWNWVAFYLYYIFSWGGWANVSLIWICAILHFVPIKFVYPSRTKRWMKLNLALFFTLMFACLFSMLVIEDVMVDFDHLLFTFRISAVVTLIYFIVLGLYITWDEEGVAVLE
jgi:phosphatidylcholine synthase